MSEIGKAYVQIVPSAKGISGSISQALDGESKSAGQSAGLNIAGAIKGAIAAAGIGTAIKATLDAAGDLQQSFGGLETLYGDAAEGAKAYAAEAVKAGISANDYAEQAVSFGAALKQAFGGDTTAAMEAANTAILDMTDNAAKMGTPIESIQNAYQGFAKQNYTMLDNLKLGYGGTKAEMERLLEDAQALSGVEYDISNLGDVYEAIHVIQEDLGLTGVAAEEAGSTFTGSLAAMKAAGENLMANLALGEDIGPALDALGDTVQAFIFNNLFPMVGNMLEQLPDLLSGLSGIIIQSLNMVTNNADEIVQIGIDVVTSLVEAIVECAPYLVEAAVSLVMALGEALLTTDWVQVANDLIESLRDSISLAAGEILGTDDSTIGGILDSITAGLPDLLESGVEIITQIANGILQNIPKIIEAAGQIFTKFLDFAMKNYPTILKAGADLLLNLVNGIVNNLPKIIESVVKIITQFISTIGENLPKILQQGMEILGKLIAGLIQAIPKLVAAIPQIVTAIFKAFASVNWGKIGIDLIAGIAKGIIGAVSTIVEAAVDAARSAFNAAKEWLGIASPSKKGIWMGQMLDNGFAIGIEKNSSVVDAAMEDLSENATAQLTASSTRNLLVSSGSSDAKMDLLLEMLANYLPEIAENKGITTEALYSGLNRQLGVALT